MYIGTGIQISQRQLKGWAGRQNRFKIIVGDYSCLLLPPEISMSGLEKISHICPDIKKMQNVGAGDVLQICVFMTDIHIIGLKIGLKRHKFVSL